MKNTLKFWLLIPLVFVVFLGKSQAPKFFDSNGKPIEQKNIEIDSTYIKSIPTLITLSNLTKSDLRIFKNMMLEKVQLSDKPYDANTKKVFDKIMSDLNTKGDTVTTFKIIDLPYVYIIEYSKRFVQSYNQFIQAREDARRFLRIAVNVQKIDPEFYLLSSEISQLNKNILKNDLKKRP